MVIYSLDVPPWLLINQLKSIKMEHLKFWDAVVIIAFFIIEFIFLYKLLTHEKDD